jgi:phosphopantothenoylcysteine decarboxylase/phosphopantothenate--cysteine ligase
MDATNKKSAVPGGDVFAGKKIALGVTGSIAAYKACELVRLFSKAGAEVSVLMTAAAQQFVTPLTFRTLSRRSVATGMFDNPQTWIPGHVSLATWCDVLALAPCTANVIAKLACGIADDIVSSVALACRKPVVIAPAMNEGMLDNPATRANIETLRARGVVVMDCGEGFLACGTEGRGRMPEPQAVFDAVRKALEQ